MTIEPVPGNRFRQVFDIDRFHRTPCLRQTAYQELHCWTRMCSLPSQGVSKNSLVFSEHNTRRTGALLTVRPGLPRGAGQRRDGKTCWSLTFRALRRAAEAGNAIVPSYLICKSLPRTVFPYLVRRKSETSLGFPLVRGDRVE